MTVIADPFPISERRRLAVLKAYHVLDSAPEALFDDLAQLGSDLCLTPTGLVSLISDDRQWFKARVGFSQYQTDLSQSICAHGLALADLLIIPDLTDDPRTAANPLVTGIEAIRFYAGAPLRVSSGETLGMLCVIDTIIRPAGLTDRQQAGLRALARQVVVGLDARRLLMQRDALVEIGERLRTSTTVEEMTRSTGAIVGHVLNVSRAGYGAVDASSGTVAIEPDWTAEGIASVAGLHRFDDYGNLSPDIFNGDSTVVEDVTTDPRTASDPSALGNFGINAMVNMPVRGRDGTAAIFFVHVDTPRSWRPDELTFLRHVADRLEVGIARLRAEQQQAVMTEQLIKISRVSAVGTMSTALTHELNQPLTAAANYVQTAAAIIAVRAEGALDLVREALDEAGRAVLLAGAIVNRLRQFVISGELDRVIMAPRELVLEACALGTVEGNLRGISCEVLIAPDISAVLVDRVHIQQVLLNLIRNAMEAIEKDGAIVICARAEPGMILVSVEDTGCGITTEQQETLFELFVSNKSTGMGLGLAICRTIVEAHGGKLWCEAAPTGGAKFYFTLPIAQIDDDEA